MSEQSVRDLRRLWKPHREMLSEDPTGRTTHLRFHRACSWMDRAEKLDHSEDPDLALLARWTALNALYGQWDGERKEPVADRECWQHFLERVMKLDTGSRLDDVLSDNKPLAMKIFEDPYLNRHFWRADSTEAKEGPGGPNRATGKAQKRRAQKRRAQGWYVEGRLLTILEELCGRIYLLRCQLSHGAATYNSRLNRDAVRHCNRMLEHLLRAFLLIWIDRGHEEDWGIACYPPLDQTESPLQRTRRR